MGFAPTSLRQVSPLLHKTTLTSGCQTFGPTCQSFVIDLAASGSMTQTTASALCFLIRGATPMAEGVVALKGRQHSRMSFICPCLTPVVNRCS